MSERVDNDYLNTLLEGAEKDTWEFCISYKGNSGLRAVRYGKFIAVIGGPLCNALLMAQARNLAEEVLELRTRVAELEAENELC